MEDDPIVDLMAEEPDAEAEPLLASGSGLNASGARTTKGEPSVTDVSQLDSLGAMAAGIEGDGELPREELVQDDLFWLRGVSEAPEYDPFDRPEGEVIAQVFDYSQPVNPPRKKRRC